MPELRIAVLISGEGRNLQSLIDACADGRISGRIVGVLSNRAEARGLVRAQQGGIETAVLSHREHASREAYDAALLAQLDVWRPDVVVLAGFMRILTPVFTRAYADRLLNVHPSLLPRHPGLHTHQAALDAGDTRHGATVHYVNEELDGGPAIIQGELTVLPDDTADTLAARVMNDIELKIYPQVLAWIACGDLRCADGVVHFRGAPLARTLDLSAVEEAFR